MCQQPIKRIYVLRGDLSHNKKFKDTRPVFAVEVDGGKAVPAHGVTINGPSWLVYVPGRAIAEAFVETEARVSLFNLDGTLKGEY